MPSPKERATRVVRRLRKRFPLLDHLLAMLEHYGRVKGSTHAGAVTYYGFLSFFPILALAFFVVGYVARVYPQAHDELITALDRLLPGLIGSGPGQIGLSVFERYAGTVGLVGLVGVLYSGLGWLSGMRTALGALFDRPKREQPNLVMGKVRDVVALVLIGLILVVSVVLSGAVDRFNARVLDWLGLDRSGTVLTVVLWLLGHACGVVASTLLLVAMFRLLASPHLSALSLWRGALVGAVAFEVLKAVATLLIAHTQDQPAFQAFGVSLVLLIWINYFSRLVLYGAAWAYTSEPRSTNPSAGRE
ncbi:MAG: YihY/virulence factor BrkB family protein [Nocardioidaceae bacterium]